MYKLSRMWRVIGDVHRVMKHTSDEVEGRHERHAGQHVRLNLSQ